MMPIEDLEKRREELLSQIEEIRTMKRETINEQYLKVPRKEKEPALRGPYYVLSRNEGGKTVGFRIKTTKSRNYFNKMLRIIRDSTIFQKNLFLLWRR